MSIILHLEKEENHLVDIVMCDVSFLESTETKWCTGFSIIFVYFTEVQLMFNILISATQQSDSLPNTYVLSHIIFHYGLS